MNPASARRLGYPGLERRPIDPDAEPDYLADGLLDSVKARPPVYRPTPFSGIRDPDQRYAAVRLRSDLPLSTRRAVRARRRRLDAGGRPAAIARLEYELEVERTDGATETAPTPATRSARRARSARSRWLAAGLRAAGVADRRGRRRALRGDRVRGRGLGANSRSRLVPRRRAARARRCRCCVAHDGPEYDQLAGAHALRGGMIAAGRAAAATASRCWRPATATSGTRRAAPTRARSHARAARDARRGRRDGAPVGMGASLGALAMLHAQRRFPRHVRRRCSCSPAASSCRASTRRSRGFARYARIVRFVRGRCAPARRAPGAGRRDRAARRGEPRQQPRDGARARRAGLRGLAARGARPAQLHRLARRARPAPDRACCRCWAMRRHARALLAGDRRRGHGRRATATTAARCSRSPPRAAAPGTSRTTGMVGAVGDLIDAGRVKLYCVDSFDAASWSDRSAPAGGARPRARRYEAWILEQVVPFIHDDLGGAQEIVATGCSMGAFHAANFALRRADLFPLAICLSGNYDPSTGRWGERGDAAYFNNPTDYVGTWTATTSTGCARASSLLLVCGQGSGRTRPARSSAPAARRAARREGHPRTSSTSGGTTSRTTGRPGAPVRPSPAPLLLMDDHPPHRTAARHRGGLADGLRDPRPPRWARSRTRPARPTG